MVDRDCRRKVFKGKIWISVSQGGGMLVEIIFSAPAIRKVAAEALNILIEVAKRKDTFKCLVIPKLRF